MQEGRPISFLSKTLGPKAATFSTYEKEALVTLIEELETLFCQYLSHNQNRPTKFKVHPRTEVGRGDPAQVASQTVGLYLQG
jgi:hypothetical protein